MPLNSSGPISLGGATSGQSINLELGQSGTAQISLGSLAVTNLSGAAYTAGTQISLSTLYRKSDIAFTLALSNNGAGAFANQVFLSRFSTGTYAAAGFSHPVTPSNGVAAINSSTQGLWLGGDYSGSTSKADEISGVTFATQTQYNPATASSALAFWCGTSYLDLAGYVMGGYDSGGSYYLNIWKYTYSTTGYAQIGATMTGAYGRIWNAAYYSATASYNIGSDQSGGGVGPFKFTFNTETVSGLGPTINAYLETNISMQSKTIGYWYNDGTAYKVTFATDTFTAWSPPSPPTSGPIGAVGTTNNIKSHVYTGIFAFGTETWSSTTLSLTYGTLAQPISVSPNIQVII